MRKNYLASLCLILWAIPLLLQAEWHPILPSSEEPAPKVFARLEGGLILVEATLNGQVGNYILDTGASHLFINKKNITQVRSHAVGLGAGTPIDELTIAFFQLGSTTFTNQTVYQMDMTHLERIKGCKIDGIIGMDMLQEFKLYVNYAKGIISLQSSIDNTLSTELISKVIPLTYQQHFPMVIVTVDQQTYNFAIDTGAEANLFFDNYEKTIKKVVKNKKATRVWGIGNTAMVMKKIELTQLHCFDQIYYNQEFMFANLAALNQSYDVSLDGVLGFPFLKNQTFTLDFKKGEMRIWE